MSTATRTPSSAEIGHRPRRGRGGSNAGRNNLNMHARRSRGGRQFGAQLTSENPTSSDEPLRESDLQNSSPTPMSISTDVTASDGSES